MHQPLPEAVSVLSGSVCSAYGAVWVCVQCLRCGLGLCAVPTARSGSLCSAYGAVWVFVQCLGRCLGLCAVPKVLSGSLCSA